MPGPPPPPPPPGPPPPPLNGAVKRTAAPPPPPPPSSRAGVPLAGRVAAPSPSPPPPPPPPAPRAPGALRRQSRVSTRSPLPPPPEFAPRLPSTPRVSMAPPGGLGGGLAEVDENRFPSFTMGTDFFDGGEEGLADITNVPRAPSGGNGKAGREDSMFNMPTPWDQPLDADMLSESVAVEERLESLRGGGSGSTFGGMSGGGGGRLASGGAGGSEGGEVDEDGEDLFDIPTRLTLGPGAAAARLDLQRCTIRVHKELVSQLATHSMKPGAFPGLAGEDGGGSGGEDDALSRAQGELFLKSRLPMRGWRRRYGSIVDHAYFGPVLFMFKYDSKGNVALHHSMMIVLVDSSVRLGRNYATKDSGYRCEFLLKTTKRKYHIAANHTMRRDYWIRNLEQIQATATSRAR